jgi:predicted methyltransferase
MKKLISVLAAAALMCGQAFAIDEVRLAAALNSAERSDADKALDAARQPIAVLSFLGLEEGMTVMDVMASGGWYTEVLSHAVGPQGKVLMHNNPASLARGTTAETVNNRVNGRLNNVERVENTFDQLGVAPASVDLAITHLNFHDVYNANPDNAMAMLAAIKEALKSGGILGIADHRGNLGADNTALHRIPLDTVAKAATDAGFYVVGVSDALYVDSDPRTAGPLDESLGRNTDRILLKLMKP